MANGAFLFVDVDDPLGRSKAKKPASQRYNKDARKHVMRDIGYSRRKEKPAKTSTRRTSYHEPIVVGGQTKQLGRAEDDQEGWQGRAAKAHRTGIEKEAGDPPMDLQGEDEAKFYPAFMAPHVGCYREDPFVRYPVEITDRWRFLLDTREWQFS
jgi:hypothetical protein